MSSYLALADGESPAPTAEPHPAPASGTSNVLYRHALESVFSFLSIRELDCALQVCRAWLAAVTSMRPLLVPMACPILTVGLFGSRLARHVSSWSAYPIQNHGVRLLLNLTASLINLRELEWTIDVPFEDDDPPVRLPTKLRVLTFHIQKRRDRRRGRDRTYIPPPTQTLPPEISAMHDLTTLRIWCPREYTELLPLADYAKATQLRALHLVIRQDNFMRWMPTQSQIDILRSMSHLHELSFPDSDMKQYLRLLEPPHSLQLRSLCWDVWYGDMNRVDEEIGTKVATLAHSLQTFKFTLNAPSAMFLRPLVNLTDLAITAADRIPECAETLVESLRDCVRLKSLRLASVSDMQSHHLAAILASKPDLVRLTLRELHFLKSLAFLADFPRFTLKDLRIESCTELPLDQLAQLASLSSLLSLDLSKSFAAVMEQDHLDTYVRQLCPTLHTLTYQAPQLRAGFAATTVNLGPSWQVAGTSEEA